MEATSVKVLNYINGEWREPESRETLNVVNPATGEVMGQVPLSAAAEVQFAADAAALAQKEWRRVPPTDRIQYLFRMKNVLEANFEELARLVTQECGKTIGEARGEMRRAIENVEVACGIPTMMQGYLSEDIAPGIDELMIRQPVGVAAAICPFNFPGMIPFWFMPYAIACGNTYIVKPSERVPMTQQRIFELFDEQVGLPKGVLNLVNGAKETVDALLDHPAVRAISFVGSTPVARYIYRRSAENGKRAQAQGGAKNPIIVLPDADMEMSTRIAADSAFGCAGQRCLAASLAITVGEARTTFTDAIADAARRRIVGYGLDETVEMGPVITPESKARIEGLISKGESAGAKVLVDGRRAVIPGFEKGNFVKPTIIDNLPPDSEVAGTELFGPVLGVMHVDTIDQAIEFVNSGKYGNMACLFTNSGPAARRFRYEAEAGNIGINVGVAAPMAFFPFSGWKDSFFGVQHGQAMDAVQFFTQEKVVVERWPKEWSRKF